MHLRLAPRNEDSKRSDKLDGCLIDRRKLEIEVETISQYYRNAQTDRQFARSEFKHIDCTSVRLRETLAAQST